MFQPQLEGGINVVNFNKVVKSLRLSWIGRLLSETNDRWKAIPRYYFRKYGGLLFLLKCNYDVALLETNLPFFYQELLQYFQEIKNATNIFLEDEYIIWNNKLITIDNSTHLFIGRPGAREVSFLCRIY